ncbi:MAG TPA: hypothetical protein VLA04_04635 [Verrucomicrobiae bacterium]|nr:hypothetical protein [Verrucomicrobiae bacterium]
MDFQINKERAIDGLVISLSKAAGVKHGMRALLSDVIPTEAHQLKLATYVSAGFRQLDRRTREMRAKEILSFLRFLRSTDTTIGPKDQLDLTQRRLKSIPLPVQEVIRQDLARGTLLTPDDFKQFITWHDEFVALLSEAISPAEAQSPWWAGC